MKRHAPLLVTVAPVVLLTACASVPRSPQMSVVPSDVEVYLRASEAKVQGIIQGNEKTVVWAADRGKKTPLSLVYLHGYPGSPRD